MTTVYQVEGMTCNGCRMGVESKLATVEGVDFVTVILEDQEAIVTSQQQLPLEQLQAVLPEKYDISIKKETRATLETQPKNTDVFKQENAYKENHSISKITQLKPLFLILGYITMATVFIHYTSWKKDEAMLDFMGLFFIVFSFFKMLDVRGFSRSFQMYDPLAKRTPAYAIAYPFIETALGLMFLMRFELKIALVATLVVLGITTVGVTKTLLDKKSIQCACLGTALKLPMTEATFIENAIMIVMAIVMLISLV